MGLSGGRKQSIICRWTPRPSYCIQLRQVYLILLDKVSVGDQSSGPKKKARMGHFLHTASTFALGPLLWILPGERLATLMGMRHWSPWYGFALLTACWIELHPLRASYISDSLSLSHLYQGRYIYFSSSITVFHGVFLHIEEVLLAATPWPLACYITKCASPQSPF